MRNAIYCVLLLAFTANADEADDAVARAAMVDEVHFYATLARDSGEEALNEDVMRSLAQSDVTSSFRHARNPSRTKIAHCRSVMDRRFRSPTSSR